eukprot:scaffold4097_cov166-Amphora_coffeaeformis.AAC.66
MTKALVDDRSVAKLVVDKNKHTEEDLQSPFFRGNFEMPAVVVEVVGWRVSTFHSMKLYAFGVARL